MQQKIFTMQLDTDTRQALDKLAAAHDRSKASVLRVLVREAAAKLDKRAGQDRRKDKMQ